MKSHHNKPRLKSARWLKNNGLQLRYSNGAARFIRPGQTATIHEATVALDCSKMMLYRLVEQGRVETVERLGRREIPLTELHRIRREWRRAGYRTTRIESLAGAA